MAVTCPLPSAITTLDATGAHCLFVDGDLNGAAGVDTCVPIGATDCCRFGATANGEGCFYAIGTRSVTCPLPALITILDTTGAHCLFVDGDLNGAAGVDTCVPIGATDCCRFGATANGEGCFYAIGTL